MFRFFKRHQKFFMGTIAVVTAFSFSFYGVYNQIIGDPSSEDPIVFVLADGTPVRSSLKEAVRRMLAAEASTEGGRGHHGVPNLVNTGVISEEIIGGGLAPAVLAKVSGDLSQEWQKIAERQRQYRPYQHPRQKSVGVKAVWGTFAPELPTLIAEETPLEGEGFLQHQRSMLQAARKVPSALTQQMLAYMERQAGVPHDEALERIDLRLFGHRSLEDWYGAQFVEGCVRLVLEGAHQATREGLFVTPVEVRQTWLHALAPLSAQGIEPREALHHVIGSLGIPEGKAVEAWQQVMLFEAWMHQHLQKSVEQDRSLRDAVMVALEQASEKAHVQVRSAPVALQSAEDLWQLEAYFEAIGRKREEPFQLPSELLTVEQVQRRAPELVAQPVHLTLRRVDRHQVATQFPMHEMVLWQLSEEGWPLLCARVRALAGQEGVDPAQRAPLLEELVAAGSQQADQLAREAWLKEHAELIEEALAEAKTEEFDWELCKAALATALPDFPQADQVLGWIDQGVPSTSVAGQRWVYRVEGCEARGAPHVVTFEVARRQGGLAIYADRRLREDYKTLQVQGDPDLFKERTARLYQDVRPVLVQRRIQKVCDGTREYLSRQMSEVPTEIDDLVRYRLAAALMTPPEQEFLASQFSPQSKDEEIMREQNPQHMAFQLAEGEWSLPQLVQGVVQRVQVLEREQIATTLKVDHPSVQSLLTKTKLGLARELLHEEAAVPAAPTS